MIIFIDLACSAWDSFSTLFSYSDSWFHLQCFPTLIFLKSHVWHPVHTSSRQNQTANPNYTTPVMKAFSEIHNLTHKYNHLCLWRTHVFPKKHVNNWPLSSITQKITKACSVCSRLFHISACWINGIKLKSIQKWVSPPRIPARYDTKLIGWRRKSWYICSFLRLNLVRRLGNRKKNLWSMPDSQDWWGQWMESTSKV